MNTSKGKNSTYDEQSDSTKSDGFPRIHGDTTTSTRQEAVPAAVSPSVARCAWPPSSWVWHRPL